jgi:SHS family lactate transporter-like MFS transporter
MLLLIFGKHSAMNLFEQLKSLSPQQRHTVLASFLGWTLDAFDFFILVFVIKDIAKEFGTDVKAVTFTLFLTLAMRPLGAFLFGVMADRYGRRPTLMANILIYSLLEFASGFAPSLTVLIILRGLYGIAMGGEWGVGASLTMETMPPQTRGFVSGLLQAGYPTGYLLSTIVFWALWPFIGWRGLFMVGVLPALLVLYIRTKVEESPAWLEREHKGQQIFETIAQRWPLFVYMILLMTAFNFFSHGTQDLYPTFLQLQHNFPPSTVAAIAIIYNIGAILGGLFFGTFSERIGRRRAICIAALLALPIIPLWAFSASPFWLAVGAFMMQFLVQGAWGVIPVHLNELSPPDVRGTFPGFTYQLGNLFAAGNATIQASLAEGWGGNYAKALAVVIVIVAIAVFSITVFGPEAKGVLFSRRAVTT